MNLDSDPIPIPSRSRMVYVCVMHIAGDCYLVYSPLLCLSNSLHEYMCRYWGIDGILLDVRLLGDSMDVNIRITDTGEQAGRLVV